MKRLITIFLTLALMVGFVVFGNAKTTQTTSNQSTPFYLSIFEQATNGNYTLTNSFTYPWKLKSISYWLPTPLTNTFTFSILREQETVLYSGDTITTNSFGFIETNTYHSVTGTVVSLVTNSLVSALVTTNVNNVMLAEFNSDYPADVYIFGGDKVVLTWSYTTAPVSFIVNGSR